ncbi:MAG: hypothetical protein WCR98_08305, partial [Saccharofermentanales bacterium]
MKLRIALNGIFIPNQLRKDALDRTGIIKVSPDNVGELAPELGILGLVSLDLFLLIDGIRLFGRLLLFFGLLARLNKFHITIKTGRFEAIVRITKLDRVGATLTTFILGLVSDRIAELVIELGILGKIYFVKRVRSEFRKRDRLLARVNNIKNILIEQIEDRRREILEAK